MSVRVRLALLMALLTLLPALPAALVARQLIERSLHLGLSADVDAALEAGVRQARVRLQQDRAALRTQAESWAQTWPGPDYDVAEAGRRMRSPVDAHDSDRVVLFGPQGRQHVLQEGSTDLHADAVPSTPSPPTQIYARHTLSQGWALEVRRRVDSDWHEDATRLANALQVMRGMKAQQADLERSFWMPFLLIYGVALLVGVSVALAIGRGITAPVKKLVDATDAVASGRRDVQVTNAGTDELGRLTQHFNSMVRTLDAQSRQLIDLETMAGWREMARALAHEVKNPLTPIQLTVEEMRERYRGSDPEYQKLLQECSRIVVEEVESLRNVVTRFREFSKPVELRRAPTDVNRLVGDVAALQRDLTIELDLDDTVGTVQIDADRMRQVLMNLAENARQATQGTQPPRLRMATAIDNAGVRLLVEDNGPGIPAAEHERIFEPYRSSRAGGLGLGLALVKGIVLAHDGTIAVEEGRWGGARFRIVLPHDSSGFHSAATNAATATTAHANANPR